MSSGKPLLRWAGGKTWLIKYLDEIINKRTFRNYHEPFFGGGAIFFALNPENNSYLSDLNGELISTYQAIKDYPTEIVNILKNFENSEEFYYKIRKEQFHTASEKAAQFIFLNQTSFNGLYRVNRNGEYNVPYGFRKKNFFRRKKNFLNKSMSPK